MPEGIPPQADPGAASDKFHVSEVVDGAVEGLGHVFEAVHEAFASPEEIAMEKMEEANHLQQQGMQALMAGDVDGGSALIAQAGQVMQSAVGHLADPDYKDPEPLASPGGDLGNHPNVGLPGMDPSHGLDHSGGDFG
jgi:hypothetical protein